MEEARKQLEERRLTLTRRLHVLQIQAAKYGISTPPHVVIEIEDTQKEIAELDRQLAALPASTTPGTAPVRMTQTELFRRGTPT